MTTAYKIARLTLDKISPLPDYFIPVRHLRGIGLTHQIWLLTAVLEGRVTGHKAHRWLGWAQAGLVYYGKLTMLAARDINRKAENDHS